MRRRTALALLSTTVLSRAASDPAVKALRSCGQLLRVESAGWAMTRGMLTLWERAGADAPWQAVGPAIPVMLGRSGMRWGLGRHGVPAGVAVKAEGDGCSPAGIFELDTGFGSVPAAQSGAGRWPWQVMTATHAGVDDPQSRHYNRIVDAAVVRKDWSSAEDMIPRSGVYRRGIVVRHNWAQKPGGGSCIFLHLRSPSGQPTAGCTAMAEPDLVRLLGWLDPARRPLLVQLPAAEWAVRGPVWGLPVTAKAEQTTKNAKKVR